MNDPPTRAVASPTPWRAGSTRARSWRAGGRQGVVAEDGRAVDGGHQVVDQVVDDLELARGAVFAREASEEWLHEVVDEAGEDARSLGGVEAGDFVAPACGANLCERCLEAAGDELFVETWGANKPIMNDE